MTEESWIDFPHVQDICFFNASEKALMPTQLPVQWESWEISPGVIWMGVKLTTGVFNNVWSNISILPYPSEARCLINPLNSELNPICKSQLAELLCGVFKFCICFSKT